MALDEDSTIEDARAQYRNSGRWRASGSLSLAHDRLEAIEFLLDAEPNTSEFDGIGASLHRYRAEQTELMEWIRAKDSNARPGPTATRMRAGTRFRG